MPLANESLLKNLKPWPARKRGWKPDFFLLVAEIIF